jgi:hypothetical protein
MDARSTTSTGSISASNRKIDCPFCTEEFQNRTIFNHIQKKHRAEFAEHIFIATEDELNKHIDYNFGVPLMWKVKNDFDELEEQCIHGCLGCGAGLPSQSSAATHCSKDKCRDKHIAGLKSLMTPIKRKEKAKKEYDAKRNPDNWTAEVLTHEIEICMRRYKYMTPHVRQLVQTYNNFLRQMEDTSKAPANFDPEPLTFNKDNLRSEYRRWLLINGAMDDCILKYREAMFYHIPFNYEMWLARTSSNPERVFIPFNSMDHPLNIELYPTL